MPQGHRFDLERAANPKLVAEEQRVSASDVLCPANGVSPRPLTQDEILGAVAAFAGAARRAREAGFDALEIPFSQTYVDEGVLEHLVNTGTYALVRHPGVLCLSLFFLL